MKVGDDVLIINDSNHGNHGDWGTVIEILPEYKPESIKVRSSKGITDCYNAVQLAKIPDDYKSKVISEAQ